MTHLADFGLVLLLFWNFRVGFKPTLEPTQAMYPNSPVSQLATPKYLPEVDPWNLEKPGSMLYSKISIFEIETENELFLAFKADHLRSSGHLSPNILLRK